MGAGAPAGDRSSTCTSQHATDSAINSSVQKHIDTRATLPAAPLESKGLSNLSQELRPGKLTVRCCLPEG